jgi:hypothetical protein
VSFIGGDHVGLRQNVERAIRACSGDVIALSDQDDVWLPGRLGAVQRAFRDPAVTLWFSDAELIAENGDELGARLWEKVTLPLEEQQAMEQGARVRRLLHGMTVTGATMAFRESVRSLALPLPTQLDPPDHLYLHDGWIAALAALTGRVVTENYAFTNYRQHERQFTSIQASLDEAQRDRSSSLTTRQAIRREHARVRLVLDRLVEREALERCSDEDRQLLTELELFLRHRTAAAGMARTRAIISALRGGRYRRYARGWRTAVADLLYPRR